MSLLENDLNPHAYPRAARLSTMETPGMITTSVPASQAIDRSQPYYDVLDIVAVSLGAFMMLGPLFVYAIGWAA
jgi:hypothetical protein